MLWQRWGVLRMCVVVGFFAWVGCGDDGAVISGSIERVHAGAEVIGGGGGEVALDSVGETEVGAEVVGPDAQVDGEVSAEIDAGGEDAEGDVEDGEVVEVEVPDLRHPDPTWPRLSAATLAAIDAEMRAALDVPALGGRTFGGFVQDIDSGQEVWALDADRLLIPASNTKVFTTAVAIDRLGADHRMPTRVVAAAPIGGDGVLRGDLALHSEHDFTWSRWFQADARHPASRLAEALWQRGLRRVTGAVHVWGAYLYEGHHFGSYDPATHRARAGAAFVAALGARGIVVEGALVDHASMAVPEGEELARWESIPLHVGAWAINRKSHNEMADILARHLGFRVGGSSDYATGGAVMKAWLAERGIDATGFVLADGSGLSLANRVSARQLVGVYRAMAERPGWEAWRASLSVAGAGGPASNDGNDLAIVTENVAPYNGTLAYRMSGADTAGRVFGKSGTNAGITTSGVLVHRWDGRRYAFAFQMNTLPGGTYDTARATQDALVAVIARRRGEGTRPAAPTLGCVRGRIEGGVALAEVALVGNAVLDAADPRAGYALELSADGVVWRRDEALFSREPSFVFRAGAGTTYLRAFAESSAGLSDPSDVYAVRVRDGDRVLLVDANDRWQRQPTNENPMGAAHAFMVAYGAAVPAHLGIDTCPNEALTAGEVALASYDAVVWATGEEATSDESIAAAEATLLMDYLEIGGALFASGAEIAWDLDARGNSAASAADRAFLEGALALSYVEDDAGVFVAEGVMGGIFADRVLERRLGFFTPGQIFVAYPDVLSPLGEARACLRYLGPGSVACVYSESEPAVVTLGFPFESIDAAAGRAVVMERVLGDAFGL